MPVGEKKKTYITSNMQQM